MIDTKEIGIIRLNIPLSPRVDSFHNDSDTYVVGIINKSGKIIRLVGPHFLNVVSEMRFFDGFNAVGVYDDENVNDQSVKSVKYLGRHTVCINEYREEHDSMIHVVDDLNVYITYKDDFGKLKIMRASHPISQNTTGTQTRPISNNLELVITGNKRYDILEEVKPDRVEIKSYGFTIVGSIHKSVWKSTTTNKIFEKVNGRFILGDAYK